MENGLFQNRFLRLQAAPKLNDGVVPVRPPIHDLEHVSPRIPVEYEWLIGKFQFHDGFFLVKLFEIVAFSVNEQGFRVFRGISWVIQHGIVIYRFIQLADGFLVMGCLRMRRMILVIVSSMQAYMSVPSVDASMVI